MKSEPRIVKLASSPLYRTAYSVWVGKKCIGYVWSKNGFSYLGSQGWNKGYRITDFHPIDWEYGKTLADGRSCHNRQYGIDNLLRGTP